MSNTQRIPTASKNDQLVKEKLKNLIQKDTIKAKPREKSRTPDKYTKTENTNYMLDVVTNKINNLKCISNNDPNSERKKEILLKYFTIEKPLNLKKDEISSQTRKQNLTPSARNNTDKKPKNQFSLTLTPDKLKLSEMNNKTSSNRYNETNEKNVSSLTPKQNKKEFKNTDNDKEKLASTLNKNQNVHSPVAKIARHLTLTNEDVVVLKRASHKCVSTGKIQVNQKVEKKENNLSKSRDISNDRTVKTRNPQQKKILSQINETANIIYQKNKDIAQKKFQINKSKTKAVSQIMIQKGSNKEFKEEKIYEEKLKNVKRIKVIGYESKKGYSGKNIEKINQDNYAIINDFPIENDSSAFFVFDGHGVNGHHVSGYLKETLPEELKKAITDFNRSKKNRNTLSQIIEETFVNVNNKLCEFDIDTEFSGSTCISIFSTPDRLFCANVGDSRAIIGRLTDEKENQWKYQLLSRDHKPGESDEEERILKKNGRIQPYQDSKKNFIGPLRVWKKDEDIPGLAMSRAFGDQVAASVGVIAEPEVFEWMFTPEDRIIVLGSDGIWEFIKNLECIEMIKEYFLNNDAQGAAKFLVEEATKRWMIEDDIIDDITVIVVFLENKLI